MLPQNLSLHDLKDIDGVLRAKRGKNDQKAFNLVYSHNNGALELKPIILPKPKKSIRHIDLALRATLINPRLQRDRAEHLVYDFPMKDELYKLWYRIYDDSGNLRSMYEQAKDRFKFNIVLDLGFVEKDDGSFTSSQHSTIPINFEAPYENVIEGPIFKVESPPTRSINVSIVLDSKKSMIFPGFRIRIFFELISKDSIYWYDETQRFISEPSFEPRLVTTT